MASYFLRKTLHYMAVPERHGVRIITKDRRAYPRSGVVSQGIWNQLEQMSDSAFDDSVVFELGIGTWERRKRRKK